MRPLNSPELNRLDYYVLGNVRSLSQALSKTEDNCGTRRNAARDSLTPGLIDKAVYVKEFSKRLKAWVVYIRVATFNYINLYSSTHW